MSSTSSASPTISSGGGPVTSFNDFLRHLRTLRAMTLGQLSVRSGISKSTLSRWESGITAPRIPELSHVFDALETPSEVRAQCLRLLEVPRAIAAVRRDEQIAPHFSLGDMLFALRQRSGKTQAQAARGAGVSRSAYAQWENDACVPSTSQLHATTFALGASGEEAVALTARTFADLPLEKDRDVLLKRYDDVILIWNFESEAEYGLHLLVLLANFGYLLRKGKADIGDIALIANAFGEGISNWHGGELAHEHYRRARHLAAQAKHPLHRHMVAALQDEVDEAVGSPFLGMNSRPITQTTLEALWGWLPAFSDNAGRAYLLAFVARSLATLSPDEALRLGDEYCQLVADNEAEHTCRLRDYGNLLRLCGRPAESVAHLCGLSPQDECRAGLIQLDLTRGLLAQGALREAGACFSEAKRILAPMDFSDLQPLFKTIERELENTK